MTYCTINDISFLFCFSLDLAGFFRVERQRTKRTMAPSLQHVILLVTASIYISDIITIVDTAGDAYCKDNTCGSVEEALELHLKEWEKPRTATQQQYGAGMHEEYIETDVLVAGVGSAGFSAALSAARFVYHQFK